MSLVTPEKIGKLQKVLHEKAKAEAEFRFYTLYDKVHRDDILEFAYRLCRANGGSAGCDGETFGDIEKEGTQEWLGKLKKELKEKTYLAGAVRRVWIDKGNGKKRPLGIPNIRDRVAQTAAMLILEPIFEADMAPEQYGYRPNRSAKDAVQQVHKLVNRGYRDVVDADLSGYFDSIPHPELMKSVARRVSDRHMLALIKQWLVVPVEEDDGNGRPRRSTKAKDQKRGVPQGAPISPLLANLYMRRFLRGWTILGHRDRLRAFIVNYADDFVICCRNTAEDAMRITRAMMGKLRLTLNEDKTSIRRVPDESIDFLGYSIGRCFTANRGKKYLGTRPSRKSISRIMSNITEQTSRPTLNRSEAEMVAKLNQILSGWGNYFNLGSVSNSYKAIDRHTTYRLRKWLTLKHKTGSRGTRRYPTDVLTKQLGLKLLSGTTKSLPWAKS